MIAHSVQPAHELCPACAVRTRELIRRVHDAYRRARLADLERRCVELGAPPQFSVDYVAGDLCASFELPPG